MGPRHPCCDWVPPGAPRQGVFSQPTAGRKRSIFLSGYLMLTRIIVEIEPNSAGGLPSRLISAAYHASGAEPVTLVLRGASPAAVDRVLDPIVVHGRRDVCGVSYVDASDRAAVRAAAQAARIGVGRTAEFRALLADLGVQCFAPEDAEAVLRPSGARGVHAPPTAFAPARSAELTGGAR